VKFDIEKLIYTEPIPVPVPLCVSLAFILQSEVTDPKVSEHCMELKVLMPSKGNHWTLFFLDPLPDS